MRSISETVKFIGYTRYTYMKVMKGALIGVVVFASVLAISGTSVSAQGMMMGGQTGTTTMSDGHTAKEEAEGKEVWDKLQSKQITCADLSTDNFATLGEYFMGTKLGAMHEAMNNRLVQMLGAEGEEAMHVTLGKRMSGCEPNAQYPVAGAGMVSMMTTIASDDALGNGVVTRNNNAERNYMMDEGYRSFGGHSGFGGIEMLFGWLIALVVIVLVARWFFGMSPMGHDHHRTSMNSALDILKERYARGEIDEKEFLDRKKNLM